MSKSYYSTIFEQTSPHVWLVIRDFGVYSWAGVPGETKIEANKNGDAVGCIRSFRMDDKPIRQKLLAHSDRTCSYTYEFCEPVPLPLYNFMATIRVTPIIDGNRAFVEWWATFDCQIDERERWNSHFVTSFRGWLEALRAHLIDKG